MPSPLDEPEQPTPSQTPVPEPETQGTDALKSQPLAIESGKANEGKQPGDGEVKTLDVGEGNVVKLDHLGPMIINSDGVSDLTLDLRVVAHVHRPFLVYKIGRSCRRLSKRGPSDYWSRSGTWSDCKS